MSKSVNVKNIITGEIKEFTSINKTAQFIGILPYHFQYQATY